jgi:hypothetical protein|nr:MAG TPA: hypothetical protein [Caudoviricetes sp.]
MYLSTTDQNDTATLIANQVRENMTGYGAVVSKVDRPGYCATAVAAIVRSGSTACTAKVAVHHNRIVYVSKAATHISYPTAPEDAGRIVRSLLSLEEN